MYIYLSKIFKTSPIVYLNHYRLKKSVFLLQNTKISITEVAYACGFSNSSYFCELFHKYYNVIPMSFRNSNKWKVIKYYLIMSILDSKKIMRLT